MSVWGGGLGEKWGRSQKAKLFGKEGTYKFSKTLLFPLNYSKKIMTAIKMPREVKTSNLTNYVGLQQVAETSAGFTGPSKPSIPRILPNAAEHSKFTI